MRFEARGCLAETQAETGAKDAGTNGDGPQVQAEKEEPSDGERHGRFGCCCSGLLRSGWRRLMR